MTQSLREIQIIRNTELALTFYKEKFKELFSDFPPDTEDDDLASIRWAVQRYDMTTVKRYLAMYLTSDNKWLKEQGYLLRWFRKNLSSVIVEKADKQRQLWVVAKTHEGLPVVSYNQFEMRDTDWGSFKPYPYHQDEEVSFP